MIKSEVAVLERKIQLTLTPAQTQNEQANCTDKNISDTIIETSNRIFITKLSDADDKKIIKGIKL